MAIEDTAEDLNGPAATTRLEEFVRNRHYRIQDACANCRHVFVRQEYDRDDELYCTHGAPERPPCMSIYMEECEPDPLKPWGEDDAGHRKWDAWKFARQVVAQGICGEWTPMDDGATT